MDEVYLNAPPAMGRRDGGHYRDMAQPNSRRVLRVGCLAAAGIASTEARAAPAEQPPVPALVVEAEGECLDAASFRERFAVLGGAVDERTSTLSLSVSVARSEGPTALIGRFELREGGERIAARSITGDSCAVVADALAVAAVLAVEEVRTTRVPEAPTSEERGENGPTPAPVPDADVPNEAPPPSEPSEKSGGIGLSGGLGVGPVKSMRVYAVASAVRSTRFGAVLGVSGGEGRDFSFPGDAKDRRTSSGRLGIVMSWGAPFSERLVVGGLFEGGLAVGEDFVHRYREGYDSSGPPQFCAMRCYDRTQPATAANQTWYSAYVAGSLIFQVPWRYALRPILGVTAMWTVVRPGVPFDALADAGVVWRAW